MGMHNNHASCGFIKIRDLIKRLEHVGEMEIIGNFEDLNLGRFAA